jgi:pimeloyl-ACP methyl ester carboxylesterase
MNQPARTATLLRPDGAQIYYETYGEGSPLILLHGFTSSGAFWKPYVTHFAKHFCVIVPDLRGHGRSTNPSEQFDHLEAAYDVFALLDELKIDKVKAIGLSYGGMALLHMAVLHPEQVEAMVVIGVSDRMTEQHRQISRSLAPDSPSWNWDVFRQTHLHGDEQIYAMLRQFHLWKDTDDEAVFSPAQLSTIEARTLVVHGDHDPMFPVSVAVGLSQAIAGSYLWVIPNGNHVPIMAHRVEEFARTALDFLQNDWAAG